MPKMEIGRAQPDSWEDEDAAAPLSIGKKSKKELPTTSRRQPMQIGNPDHLESEEKDWLQSGILSCIQSLTDCVDQFSKLSKRSRLIFLVAFLFVAFYLSVFKEHPHRGTKAGDTVVVKGMGTGANTSSLLLRAHALRRARRVAETAMPMSTRLIKEVDPSCVLELSGDPKKEKAWRLVSPNSGLDHRTGQEDLLDRHLATNALLCRLVGQMAENATSPQPGSFALISMADRIQYLRKVTKRGARETLWEMLDMRRRYAERQKLLLFNWFGSFGKEVTRPRTGDWAAPPCTDKGGVEAAQHSYKALGILKLFEQYPQLDAVAFMDADTYPINFQLDPRDYMKIAPDANIIGTSNLQHPVIMNGGVWILKNTPWSKVLMQRWWTYRCGSFDQGAFWRSMFDAWKEEVGFSWSPTAFQRYASARKLALDIVVKSPALRPKDPEVRCDGECGEVFAATGCLMQPLLLPKVLMLPVVPFKSRGQLFMPLQNHVGKDQWMCHFDSNPRYCYDDPGSKWKGEYHVSKPVMAKCKSNSYLKMYECDCHLVVLGKPALKRSKKVR